MMNYTTLLERMQKRQEVMEKMNIECNDEGIFVDGQMVRMLADWDFDLAMNDVICTNRIKWDGYALQILFDGGYGWLSGWITVAIAV